MSESVRPAPLSVFIPAYKFVDHIVKFEPDWWDAQGASKKGTYPTAVLVRSHVSAQGVRISLEPWCWTIHLRARRIVLTESIPLEQAYEAERDSAGELAAEEARKKAILEFPSYRRWLLTNELINTPH